MLPPGHEDKLLCPESRCKVPKTEWGMVGFVFKLKLTWSDRPFASTDGGTQAVFL